MRVALLTVGRPRQSGLADAIREYETRAARYWSLDVIEVKEESARGLSVDQVREREGARLLERVTPDARVVACDPGGDVLDSEAFAAWLGEQRDRAQNVAFAIGGAYGLGDAVKRRATRRLSLAPWTLPHELARLVLAEQLYRAGTISRGEPYHK
ncbi:MAG: 23S rRNA (pseudouridine(1915)-N(3))-methyltransferase RlmH [Gemmatimonadaceae bacterium]|nr:23S rRNA (pseudouridine(1915)-N(3))-methyltransferase RlmH [Gemmatimonadaceae bacterium]MCC6429762.1 23S rRNA (pseudouridine(1915)-N(3))-methyltransferase RlmH [Gemmatimonadaceae bacterium]